MTKRAAAQAGADPFRKRISGSKASTGVRYGFGEWMTSRPGGRSGVIGSESWGASPLLFRMSAAVFAAFLPVVTAEYGLLLLSYCGYQILEHESKNVKRNSTRFTADRIAALPAPPSGSAGGATKSAQPARPATAPRKCTARIPAAALLCRGGWRRSGDRKGRPRTGPRPRCRSRKSAPPCRRHRG